MSFIIQTSGVTAPEDWAGHKYLYVNGAWEPNPDWVEPTP